MNKKTLLCVAGITAIFGTAFSFFSGSTIDSPLKRVSFTSGGDMQGSYHGMTIKEIDDKSAMVCVEDAKWHNQIPQVNEYIVPKTVLEDIQKIFNENKLASCEKKPKSPVVALDAATSGYNFYFKDKDISFKSTQMLSKDNYDALKKISLCVAEACKKGERLPGLFLEKDAKGELPIEQAAENGNIGIRVIGYKGKLLTVLVQNATDAEKVVSINSKLIDLAKPDLILAEKNENKTVKLIKYSRYEHNWKLDKRLDAGKYCLTLGDYKTEFEIR